MIVVPHTEECSSRPVKGQATGVCNCKVAPLMEAARQAFRKFVGGLAGASCDAEEDPAYFVKRLYLLLEEFEHVVGSVERVIKWKGRLDAEKRVKALSDTVPAPDYKALYLGLVDRLEGWAEQLEQNRFKPGDVGQFIAAELRRRVGGGKS